MGKKWSESRPAEKMLSLYTLLLTSSQPVRLTELSRLLNCAKQSVTRLIDQLESSHFGKIVRHQLGASGGLQPGQTQASPLYEPRCRGAAPAGPLSGTAAALPAGRHAPGHA